MLRTYRSAYAADRTWTNQDCARANGTYQLCPSWRVLHLAAILVTFASACAPAEDPLAKNHEISAEAMYGGSPDGVYRTTIAMTLDPNAETDNPELNELICGGVVYAYNEEKGLACAAVPGHCLASGYRTSGANGPRLMYGGESNWSNRVRRSRQLCVSNSGSSRCDVGVVVVQTGATRDQPVAYFRPATNTIVDDQDEAVIWQSFKHNRNADVPTDPSNAVRGKSCQTMATSFETRSTLLGNQSDFLVQGNADLSDIEDIDTSTEQCAYREDSNDSGSVVYGTEQPHFVYGFLAMGDDEVFWAIQPTKYFPLNTLLAECNRMIYGDGVNPEPNGQRGSRLGPLTPTGDVNHDCMVGDLDLELIGAQMGNQIDPSCFSGDGENDACMGDVDGDGDVDSTDLDLAVAHLGSACTTPGDHNRDSVISWRDMDATMYTVFQTDGRCRDADGNPLPLCVGDADGDRDADNDDLLLTLRYLSQSASVKSRIDLNHDGSIDRGDLEFFDRRYGRTECVTPACVGFDSKGWCLDAEGDRIYPCPGDLNGSGVVDAHDRHMIEAAMGTPVRLLGDLNGDCATEFDDVMKLLRDGDCDSGPSARANICAGDITGDWKVDMLDLLALHDVVGRNCADARAHNRLLPEDVNGDGVVTSPDLDLIDDLIGSSTSVPVTSEAFGMRIYPDVDGDGRISTADRDRVRELITLVTSIVHDR